MQSNAVKNMIVKTTAHVIHDIPNIYYPYVKSIMNLSTLQQENNYLIGD